VGRDVFDVANEYTHIRSLAHDLQQDVSNEFWNTLYMLDRITRLAQYKLKEEFPRENN